jgi:hypothetical protein
LLSLGGYATRAAGIVHLLNYVATQNECDFAIALTRAYNTNPYGRWRDSNHRARGVAAAHVGEYLDVLRPIRTDRCTGTRKDLRLGVPDEINLSLLCYLSTMMSGTTSQSEYETEQYYAEYTIP